MQQQKRAQQAQKPRVEAAMVLASTRFHTDAMQRYFLPFTRLHSTSPIDHFHLMSTYVALFSLPGLPRFVCDFAVFQSM